MFSGSDKKTDFDYAGGDLEAMMQAGNYYRWIRDIIRPYVGDSVVEVGAGVGSFSRLIIEDKPKHIMLVEPSKKMHKKLSESFMTTKSTKVTTHNDYLKGLETKLKKSKPDTFVYINVFEHIEDDADELTRIANVLQEGGNVIIFVPALKQLYSNFDRSIGHYRRYTKKRLRKICDVAGLEVTQLRYMDMPGMLPWWFSFVLMKRSGLVPALVSTYDNFCVPIIRTAEQVVPAPIGKNLLLVATKPKR